MIEDLFVPDPPAGDKSNRIADTRFVQQTIASAIATAPSNLPSIAGLSVIGNASTAAATAAAITGAANQLLAVNSAATTVLFTSVSSYIDNAVGSTVGQILYRNAATWVQAGGMVLLNTLSPNNVASATDTTSLTSTFRSYMITFENVCPATNNANFGLQVATSGANWISTNYISVVALVGSSNSTTTMVLLSATSGVGNGTTYGVHGTVRVFNPASSLFRKHFVAETAYLNGTTSQASSVGVFNTMGYQDTSAAVTGMSFQFTAGNIQTGTIKIYGIT